MIAHIRLADPNPSHRDGRTLHLAGLCSNRRRTYRRLQRVMVARILSDCESGGVLLKNPPQSRKHGLKL